MFFDRKDKSYIFLLNTYSRLLYPRMVEEKMLLLLRQGKITKWFSGIGQEAIAVGSTLAMNASEYILPMHRNLGVFTTRDIPLVQLMKQWLG
ncbi:MAG: dehydrogenase, partial [Pedobacter sp.]